MLHFGLLLGAFALLVPVTAAPAEPMPPRIWDIELGTPVAALPAEEFVEPACGTNGGPAGQPIGSFANFARCPPEASGLREVWFIYDDELEYVARAVAPSAWGTPAGTPMAIAEDRLVERYRATQIMLHPVILSLLIDDAGSVRGYRIFTDPRSDPDLRLGASSVAITFKGRFGTDGWTCVDLPRTDGEQPMGSPPREVFIKQRCDKALADRHVTVESRQYYKAGQSYLDPVTGKPTINEFESRSSVEVIAAPGVVALPPPQQPASSHSVSAASPKDAFVAGLSRNCPGCDLTGLNFKRRDLSGADLRGADLTGTSFHRAILRGADLSAARLNETNFNRAVLSGASLSGATLTGALLYQADAGRADFTQANLAGAHLRRLRAPLARFDHADLTGADLEDGRLSQASFRSATLNAINLYLAVLPQADLTDARIEDAMLARSNLRGAILAGASLRSSDLYGADLSNADASRVDFGASRLLGATLSDADRTGAIFRGALMPDNTVAP